MFLLLASFVLPDTANGVAKKNVQFLTARSFVASQKKDPYRARVYIECGIESVTEADYGAEHVTAFYANTSLGAMCAYGTDKTLDGNPLPAFDGPQSEAHRQSGSVHLWRGDVYVRVRGKGDKALALMKTFATLIPSPREVDPAIERMRALPSTERIPGSDRYIAKNVYGWNTFVRGYSADYACGEASLSIANIDTAGGVERLYERIAAEARQRGYTVSDWKPALHEDTPPLPKYTLEARPPSGPVLYVFRTDTKLIAIDADIAPTACRLLLEELLRMLR